MSDEEIRLLEARWKSDVDLKLDNLIARGQKYDAFLDMLIDREKRRAELQQSIINKTLTGLIMAALIGLGSLAWAGLESHLRHAVDALKNR